MSILSIRCYNSSVVASFISYRSLLLHHSSSTLSKSMRVPGEGADAGGFALTVMAEKKRENGLVEYEVPDTIIGAVLGPKAKTLNEIQSHTGCKVMVHKRMTTECSEGHRLITLQGEEDAIIAGREMIEKVINEEQARRTAGGAPHQRSSAY